MGMNFIGFSKSFETQSKSGTEYRVRPNPDGPLKDGFKNGIVIEFRDNIEDGWQGYFFIAPECAYAFAKIFDQVVGDMSNV